MVHLPFRNLGIWDVLCLSSEPECGEEAYCRGRYLSETELGIIGAVLFFTYAVGKFTNGFLADRSNINRFMSTGLLVTALVNLFLGFVHSFILFAILWGISGWFQSMGAASCVVGLSRWFTDKERGSFYGFGVPAIILGRR